MCVFCMQQNQTPLHIKWIWFFTWFILFFSFFFAHSFYRNFSRFFPPVQCVGINKKQYGEKNISKKCFPYIFNHKISWLCIQIHHNKLFENIFSTHSYFILDIFFHSSALARSFSFHHRCELPKVEPGSIQNMMFDVEIFFHFNRSSTLWCILPRLYIHTHPFTHTSFEYQIKFYVIIVNTSE